jgi:hypothetical protein
MPLLKAPQAKGRTIADNQGRTRCSSCYICIYHTHPLFGPGGCGVKVGTLDDIHNWITPDAHLFVRSKMPFVVIPEGVKAWETVPETLECYSVDSIKRMVALNPSLAQALPTPQQT